MWCPYACGSTEHGISRRGFLAGLTAGALGVGPFARAAAAGERRRVLVVWLHGGASQLET